MLQRNFHPYVGQKVWIDANIISDITPEQFRTPQTVESFMKVPVSDVEEGYIYSIDLEGISFLFTEFDLKPIE